MNKTIKILALLGVLVMLSGCTNQGTYEEGYENCSQRVDIVGYSIEYEEGYIDGYIEGYNSGFERGVYRKNIDKEMEDGVISETIIIDKEDTELIGCNKSIETEEIKETQFPCAEGRECIDVCDSTLLVMRVSECRTGCTTYNGKLVGAYELQYALESCG